MFKGTIKTIFFDLDNTLFDHTRAEATTLKVLLKTSIKADGTINQDDFVDCYVKHNTALWEEMARGTIAPDEVKVKRFELTLTEFDFDHPDLAGLAADYLELYSQQKFCLPNARKILDYLCQNYELGILSNGFAETQRNKIVNLDFTSYFTHTIFSGDAGAMKPAAEIFNVAMTAVNSTPEQILYIGDSYENDIVGAHAVGWRTIHLNPLQNPVYKKLADAEIRDLLELKDLL